MRSFDEILSAMEREYENLAGIPAAEASDIGIRLRLLAGEIMSLENSLDFMERQTDPKTAQGEYLELLAAEKGLERRGETKAKGKLIERHARTQQQIVQQHHRQGSYAFSFPRLVCSDSSAWIC